MKQLCSNQKYQVVFEEYAEQHYIKDFEKKYKTHWSVTRRSIADALERITNLEGTSRLDFIYKSNRETYLFKFDFKIAKTDFSPKTSGNRCIVEVYNQKLEVKVLLVYAKNHIDRPDGQETMWWRGHVENTFNISRA
jgi:hypothetical protein